jgi:hypothetical protein
MERTEEIGIAQMKAIIKEIVDFQSYPTFTYLNNVLSCKEVLGDFELWLSWGKLRIVPKEKNSTGTTAGDLDTLQDWNTQADGTIILIPNKEEKDSTPVPKNKD